MIGERIVILGAGGAGKSTLAAAISAHTGIAATHLDVLFWRAGWQPAPEDEAVRELAEVVKRDQWIVDGSFLAHRDEDGRFERADTVVFLDLPRWLCLWRVLVRLVRDRRRSRPDLPDGCSESFDPALLRWIWRYPRTDRPVVLQILAGLGEHVAVHHLRSRADARRFVASVQSTSSCPASPGREGDGGPQAA